MGKQEMEKLLSQDPKAKQVQFEQGNMHELTSEFPGFAQCFDIVCSCFVFHYSADLRAVFEGCRYCSKPGGELIFVANMILDEQLPERVSARREITIQLGKSFFVKNLIYTKREYDEALAAAGWTVEFFDFRSNQKAVVRDSRNEHVLLENGNLSIDVVAGLFRCY